jgi:hypothetical protein
MQEFESISASSYDPSALATKLTAKAAEGWTVVAIVPTGGDVTAYVSRESDAAAEPKKDVEVVEEEAVAVESVTGYEAEPEAEPEPESEPEPTTIEAESTPEVSEPSGWAVAPESASPASEPSVAAETAVVPTTSYQPSITPTAASPSAMGPSAVSPAAAPAAARPAEPSLAPAVPAGWYADPAGRFELRYWDGTTWTEHVSRTGQQFTDPPVA